MQDHAAGATGQALDVSKETFLRIEGGKRLVTEIFFPYLKKETDRESSLIGKLHRK